MQPDRRSPDHSIDPQFHQRWSPRAFTDEAIPRETLTGLFEAARWAPSAFNAQPWRFAYALRGTPAFERFVTTLLPANQVWASKAAALVAVASCERFVRPGTKDLVPSSTHSFDAGAAWAQFALQAHSWGWSTHAMSGFDAGAAREALLVPGDHKIEVFVAVGRQGDASTLPDWAREREKPSDRKLVVDLIHEGTF